MNAPAGNTSPIKSGHPLVELTLTRLRLFFREPGAVFRTFGFPLLLTVALGAAFRNRPPEPVAIGVESEPLAETLRRDPGLRVQVLDNDGAARVALRTRKLLKRLVATPMSRAHFLMSFVLMRALFLFLELPVLLGFGWLTFRVGVAGSLPLLLGVAILGALAFAGLGLLVASRAQNTPTVTGLINLVMLPMFVASGVFFSTGRFPDAAQPFLRILPLTALNDAMRAIMIDGAGLRAVLAPVALLAGIAAVCFAVALKVFRWR